MCTSLFVIVLLKIGGCGEAHVIDCSIGRRSFGCSVVRSNELRGKSSHKRRHNLAVKFKFTNQTWQPNGCLLHA